MVQNLINNQSIPSSLTKQISNAVYHKCLCCHHNHPHHHRHHHALLLSDVVAVVSSSSSFLTRQPLILNMNALQIYEIWQRAEERNGRPKGRGNRVDLVADGARKEIFFECGTALMEAMEDQEKQKGIESIIMRCFCSREWS